MKNKYSKQLEDKFMKQLQDINIDSQSDNDDGYYQAQRLRLQQQINAITNKKNNNNILDQLKKTTALEGGIMLQFQNQMSQIFKINKDQQNQILQKSKIQAIKQKIYQQQNLSNYALSDQIINAQNIKIIKDNQQKLQLSDIYKKKNHYLTIQNQKIIQKIEKASIQRELLMMERQDQYSIKYQLECQSQFFKDRFINPSIKIYKQQQKSIIINLVKPKSSFTNLRPMPNTQYNVLPKNSPEIALRNIRKQKKQSLIPKKKTNIKTNIIKINNPQSEAQQKDNKINKQETYNNQIDKIIIEYIRSIKSIFREIDKRCKQYKPKFIKKFLDQHQKNVNIDISDNQKHTKQKSLQNLHQDGSIQTKVKQIAMTFQSLTSLLGIQLFKQIQSAALQYNIIKQINPLQNCKKLIQINISHNVITNINNFNLPWLRFLNISNNKLKKINLKCQNLQILILNNNIIQQVDNFNKNIRFIDLSYNKLRNIQYLKNCYFLQQINLKKNRIKLLEGIQDCILLRKIDLSQNIIQLFNIKIFIYLFLNQINLSNNLLKNLPDLYLPSLQKLYLENNKLHIIDKNIFYLPNLKILNLDKNNLQGFTFIWGLLLYSKKLQILKYDNNQYFLILRQKVRQLYEYIIYKNMKQLNILNQNPVNIGLLKYYQSVYSIYLQKKNMFKQRSQLLIQLQQYIQFILKQNKMITKLQQLKIKFIQTNQFIKYRSIQMVNYLLQIGQFLQQSKNNNKLTISQKLINQSIFYQHDQYQLKLRSSLHKIKTMLIKWRYRKTKRFNYYKKNYNQIVRCSININKVLKKLLIKQSYDKIYLSGMKFTKQQAAIYIQKIWRGYRIRKRYLKMLKKLKQKQYDQFQQLQQIDLSQFDNIQKYQFNFNIPDHLNFEDYIIKPQVFQLLQKKQQKYRQKDKNNEKINNNQKQKKLVNNFIIKQENQSSISKPINQSKISENQEDQRLMKEWGFKNKETLEGFKMKRRKKQEMKRKQEQKNMTAAQRFQKFKNK